MNRFAIILTEDKEHERRKMYESFSADLRTIFPKLLLIPPNVFLFQSEKDLQGAYSSLPKSLRQGDRLILIQLGDGYRGTALREFAAQLEKFFPQ